MVLTMRAVWLWACLMLVSCGQRAALSPNPSPASGRGEQYSSSPPPLREGVGQSFTLPVREGVGASSSLPLGEGRERAAQRIVTLTPGLAELIYAVGAEQALVGTVEYSDYPQAAKRIPRVGDAFRVDLEKLLSLKPDLVLAWTSGTPATTVKQIQTLGLRVESIDALHLSEIGASLRRVGELTAHQAQAQQAAQAFDQGINALRAEYAGYNMLRVFVEVERQPLYTVNGKQVLSEVLQLCGGINVFADLDQLAPTIGVEAVLSSNPDVILAMDGTVAQVEQDWQIWSQLNAVKNKHIYAVSPDTTTRATPRLLQGARDICQALQQARQ